MGKDVIAQVAALADESIYDGASRCATPDEVWNFSRGDGLEKCLLVANALSLDAGEIVVDGGEAALVHANREICRFRCVKKPLEPIIRLHPKVKNDCAV